MEKIKYTYTLRNAPRNEISLTYRILNSSGNLPFFWRHHLLTEKENIKKCNSQLQRQPQEWLMGHGVDKYLLELIIQPSLLFLVQFPGTSSFRIKSTYVIYNYIFHRVCLLFYELCCLVYRIHDFSPALKIFISCCI